jgi:anaerobic magnesium-protoporphyrin IX monomethyl ester cyclase
MVDWVEFLYHQRGVRWLNIIDDNFTYDKKFAKAFCLAMIDLNLPDLKFGTPNGIRMERGDVELWGLLKQAGWETIVLAPESGSQDTLDEMKKDLDFAIVPRIVSELKDAGLKVQAFFILGYPGETMEDIKKTSKFITDCRFNFIFMNNFQPLPGTPIYDDLVSQGQIEDGLMPINYSDGVRVYTPPGLKNFNFPMFVLRKYLSIMLRDPLNIPYMFTLFHPLILVKKVSKNIFGMFPKPV